MIDWLVTLPILQPLFGNKEKQLQRFGLGDPEEEKQCEMIHVFMAMRDYKTGLFVEVQKKRKLLPPDTTIQQAKEQFGRPLDQHIFDESGFRIEGDDLNQPLWRYSCKCRLNLLFKYDHAEQLETGVESLKDGIRQGWRSGLGTKKDDFDEDEKK